MKRLYYIRHGQSVMNVQGLFAGRTNTPLTEEGKQQALTAGKQAQLEGIKIDVIFASPLDRAHQTAKLFVKGAKLPPSLIELNDNLQERNYGSLEATPYSRAASVSLLEEPLPAGVESWSDLIKRAAAILEIVQMNPKENILLVGHGGIGRAIRKLVEPEADVHAGIPNATLIRWI